MKAMACTRPTPPVRPPTTGFPCSNREPSRPTRSLRSPSALSMEVHNGYLYMGTNRQTELVRIDANDNWDIVVGEPRASTPRAPSTRSPDLASISAIHSISISGRWEWTPKEKCFWALGTIASVYGNSRSCPNCSIPNSDFDLMQTTDGITWTTISKNGMGDGGKFWWPIHAKNTFRVLCRTGSSHTAAIRFSRTSARWIRTATELSIRPT